MEDSELLADRIVQEVYEKGFSLTDGILDTASQHTLLKMMDGLIPHFKQASIGHQQDKQTNAEIRKDKIYWLSEDENLYRQSIGLFLPHLITGLNRRCFLGINDHEFMAAIYSPGDFYKKHRDAFRDSDARKITVILYLNPNWKMGDGGELVLHLPDNTPLIIAPLGGRLLVFESTLEHEVLAAHTNRYSITGWLKQSSLVV